VIAMALGCEQPAPGPAPGPTPPAVATPNEPAPTPPTQPVGQGQLIVQQAPSSGPVYHLYLPAGYKADQQWPLVLLGDDARLYDGVAPGRISAEWQTRADANGWVLVGMALNLSSSQPDSLDETAVNAVMSDVLSRWSIDRDKIYATPLVGLVKGLVNELVRRQPMRFTELPGAAP